MERIAGNVVGLACAASAGVHAALTPAHLEEAPLLGIGLAVAAVCLLTGALAFSREEAPTGAVPAVSVLLIAATGLLALVAVSHHIRRKESLA
jgi:drug/metabolite transporter (DMT)-like permease